MARRKRPSRRKKRFIDQYLDEGNIELIDDIQRYLADRDLYDDTNLLEIFNALYDSEDKLTFREIELKYFIQESALRGFILKINEFAEKKQKVKLQIDGELYLASRRAINITDSVIQTKLRDIKIS